MRTKTITLAIVLLGSRLAAAQPPPPPPAPSQPAPPAMPTPPPVSDPMLATIAPPGKTVATWGDALSMVKSRSTDLKISYDEVQRAEGQSRIALAAALPSLNGSVSLTHQILNSGSDFTGGGVSRGSNTLAASVTLKQAIIDVGAWHAIGTAHVSEEASRLGVDDLKRTLTASLASTIVSVVVAERIADLNRVGLRNALERLELTRTKEKLGAANGLDVLRARQDAESARSSVVSGDESLRQAREALGLALGLTEQVGVGAGMSLANLEQSALASCKAAGSLDQRADLAEAAKKVEIADRNVTGVYHQFLPTLDAQSTLSVSTSDGSGGGNGPAWSIAGVLSVPIWDGGARYGSLKSTKALKDEAQESLESDRRGATVQVGQARRSIDVAAQTRDVAASSRDLAAQVDQATQAAYRMGQGTSLDLVVAATALRQAEINLALQDANVVKARIGAGLAQATCTW